MGAPSRERSAFFTPERDGRQDAIRGSDRPSREPLIIARRTSVVQCAGLAVDVSCVRRCRTHLPGSLQYDGNRVCLIDLGSPDKRPRPEVSPHGPACPSCGKLLAQEGCLDLTKHSRRTKTFEDGLKASIKGVVFADGSCPADRFLNEEIPLEARAAFEGRMRNYGARGWLRNPEQMRDISEGQKAKRADNETVSEMKVDKGPGYRLYGVKRGNTFLVTHGMPKPKDKLVAAEAKKTRQYIARWERESG